LSERSDSDVHDSTKNDLDQYMNAEIVKELQGGTSFALNREIADAIMLGVSENRTGVGAVSTGRVSGVS